MSYGSGFDEENEYLYGIQGETYYMEFQLKPRSKVATIDFQDSSYKNFDPSVSLNLPGQRLSSITIINDGPSGLRFSLVRYDNSSQADIYVKSGEPHTLKTHGKQIRRANFVWAGATGSTSGCNVRVIGII